MRRSVLYPGWLPAFLLACAAAFGADAAAIREAAAALQRGDFAAAEQTLRAELRTAPDDAFALSLLGLALDNQKKFEEAAAFHRRALASAPRSPDAQSNYGMHLLLAGDGKSARDAFLKAVAIDPAHYNANVQLARMALQRKNGAEALERLAHLPANQQELPGIAILRAQALLLAGKNAEADSLLDRLGPAAQADPRLSFSLGVALTDAGQPAKAETFLSRALASSPADFSALYAMGTAAVGAGHYERAREVLEAALRQQPQNVDVLYSLAFAYRALNERESAIRLLAQAAQIAPQRSDVQKLVAIATAESGALADSIAAWDRYIKLEPGDDFARCERGLRVALSGRFEEGIADMKWFVARHPKDADGYYYLGVGESGADQVEGMKDFDRAVSLRPDFAEARAARGSLYYRQGRPEAALSDLEFAATRKPEDPVILDKLGQTYLALDRAADAARVLRKAAELAPDDSKTLLHLGRALADAGQPAESKAAMDRFRQLGPSARRALPAGVIEYLSLSPDEQRADYRKRLEQAVAKDPNDAAAQAGYLKALLADGDVDAARNAARRIAASKPSAAVLAGAGRALLESKEYALGKELLEQAAAAGASADVQLDLAIAAFHVAGPEEGVRQMDRVPETARTGDYYLARAYMLSASARMDDATAAISKALGAAPKRSDLYREAAALLAWNSRAADAMRVLDKAAELLPGDREILLMKSVALELDGRSGDSARLLGDMQNRWPEWHAVWVARGVILAAHREFDDARQALETAVVLGAHSPEMYFCLAESSFNSSPRRIEAAQKAIGEVLKLTPGDSKAQSLAARIASEKGDPGQKQPPATAGDADSGAMRTLFLTKPPQAW